MEDDSLCYICLQILNFYLLTNEIFKVVGISQTVLFPN